MEILLEQEVLAEVVQELMQIIMQPQEQQTLVVEEEEFEWLVQFLVLQQVKAVQES